MEVFPPGEFLRDELEARNWSQADLAEIMGRPAGLITDIIKGKRGITAETATELAAALGTSPELWMNLDAAYQLSRVENDKGSAIARRAALYAKAPIKDMVRRGWIEPSRNIDVLEQRVCEFLNIDDIDDEPDVPLHAARKSTDYASSLSMTQKVWLIRAAQLARYVRARPYYPERLQEVIDRLLALRRSPRDVEQIPIILSEGGIRLVIVQALPGSRIDGACFWVDESPVIAMTLRFDRIDNFWFVLMHELKHVLDGEAALDVALDSPDLDSSGAMIESEANAFATDHLVPAQRLDEFIRRSRLLYTVQRVSHFADEMGVHPGIVVGQLQHRREISYSRFRKLLVPIREWITPAAVTDGWDTTALAKP